MRNRTTFILAIAFLVSAATAQAQHTGGNDYAAGGSSVMWHASPGALFLNPAELARIRQSEFHLSTDRLSDLYSLSATHFEPFVGTFALGVANYGSTEGFSLGYARRIDSEYIAGGSLNILSKISGSLSYSFGISMHLPDDIPESGYHAGFSAINIGPNFPHYHGSLNAGAAYWIAPGDLRAQAAWQKNSVGHAMILGAEVRVVSSLWLQTGTRALKSLTGGFSVRTSYLHAQLGAGKQGIVFSLTLPIGEQATALRDKHYQLGMSALSKQDFRDARERFLISSEYDEASANARTMAQQASATLDSLVVRYLRQGKTFEARNNFLKAIRRYRRVVQLQPDNNEAHASLARIGPKRELLVRQLIAAGDSLKTRRDLNSARQTYTRALDIDPDNSSIVERLSELEASERGTIRQILSRAKTFADKNQLDEAQQEYERVQSLDPGNAAARSGLAAVRSKRIAAEIEQGKALSNEGRFFDALLLFSDILARDENNGEVAVQLQIVRDTLQSEADNYYKIGLQNYVREEYKAAMEYWDKVLLIDPTHRGALEYRKRADEKLKALERLR
ncbi:MAG: hypothetical protein L0Y80_02325 [Ignavibacteriae bacterium]|nr:hypothetical protein [Ignavibacteriota bacterium]